MYVRTCIHVLGDLSRKLSFLEYSAIVLAVAVGVLPPAGAGYRMERSTDDTRTVYSLAYRLTRSRGVVQSVSPLCCLWPCDAWSASVLYVRSLDYPSVDYKS